MVRTAMQLKDVNEATGYRRIYLAPHPDDAVLSCGGTIAIHQIQGEKQLVVTLCSAIPSAAAFEWHQRLEEDARALSVLGVDSFCGGFLDAPFRAPAYSQPSSLFGAPCECDVMQARLRQLLDVLMQQNADATLYAPLGVGSHVDHDITFQAAHSLEHFARVLYYEDFPYTIKARGALQLRLESLSGHQTAVVTDVVSGFQKKTLALEQYTSQVQFLFGDMELAIRAAVEEAERVLPGSLGERIWSLRDPGLLVLDDQSQRAI